ncbi:MAG: tetratricopeptide repeat protein [Planctomycetota bacterium]
MLRALGTALEQSGNIEGAIRQYEESYKRRPSDMNTVRLLVGSLVRSGQTQRALEVLRAARVAAGLDEEIGETWIALETQLGDRRLAQRLRENRYLSAPVDTRNASALATMLAMSAPDRLDVTNERGEPAYTEGQWRALEAEARNSQLERVRREWRDRSERIYRDLLKREPGNVDAANAFALLLRALGRLDESESVLVAAVGAAGDQIGWRGLVMLGNMQVMVNAPDRARATFAKAIEADKTGNDEAVKSIIDLMIRSDQYALAEEYLVPLTAKSTSDRSPLFRLSEVQMRLGKIDEARASFDKAVAGGKREVGAEMLDGAIAVAAGDAARDRGDAAAARKAYESAVAPFQRAKQLSPAAPQPFVQDTILKRKLYEITGEKARLEEALASATRATTLGGSFFPACEARSDVLLASGDFAGAVAELERFLKIVPTSVDARRRVVELLTRTGNLARAEESLREAIGFSPGEPGWHFALGEVLARANRFGDAAEAYRRADELLPEFASLFRELDARIKARDFRGATETGRRRADAIRGNSTARAYIGAALIGLGDRAEGVRVLTESYAQALQAFESGNPTPLAEWFGPLRLVFGPQQIGDVETMLAQVTGGKSNILVKELLASLALAAGGEAGAKKALEYLAGGDEIDFTAMPMVGVAVLDRMGSAYYFAGQCEKALTAYEKALKFAPGADAVLNNYAYLCGECLKDPKRGLPSARLAVQMQPTRSEYLDTLGTLLLADGQPREALDILNRAAANGDSATVQYHRAQAFEALGLKREARESAERSKSMKPDAGTAASLEQLLDRLK